MGTRHPPRFSPLRCYRCQAKSVCTTIPGRWNPSPVQNIVTTTLTRSISIRSSLDFHKTDTEGEMNGLRHAAAKVLTDFSHVLRGPVRAQLVPQIGRGLTVRSVSGIRLSTVAFSFPTYDTCIIRSLHWNWVRIRRFGRTIHCLVGRWQPVTVRTW